MSAPLPEARIVIECSDARQRAAIAALISTALRHAGIVVAEREALSPAGFSASVQRARFVAADQGVPLALLLTRPAPVSAETIEAAARSHC